MELSLPKQNQPTLKSPFMFTNAPKSHADFLKKTVEKSTNKKSLKNNTAIAKRNPALVSPFQFRSSKSDGSTNVKKCSANNEEGEKRVSFEDKENSPKPKQSHLMNQIKDIEHILRSKIERLENARVELQTQIDLSKENSKKSSEKISNLQQENETLERKLKKIEEVNNVLSKENNRLAIENKGLHEKFESMDKQQFKEMKNVYDKYILLQNDHTSEKRELQRKCETMEEQLATCKHEMTSYKKRLAEISEERKNKERSLKEERETSQGEFSILQKELSDQYIVVNEKELEITKLMDKVCNHLKQIQDLDTCVNEKNIKIKSIERKLIESEEKCKKNTERLESQCSVLEQNNIELLNEVIRCTEKMSCFEKELDSKNCVEVDLRDTIRFNEEKMKSLTESLVEFENLKSKSALRQEEMIHIRETCKTLRATNELLNVRIDSLNEILRVQEVNIVGDEGASLLNAWRLKVYSLLVQLKSSTIN